MAGEQCVNPWFPGLSALVPLRLHMPWRKSIVDSNRLQISVCIAAQTAGLVGEALVQCQYVPQSSSLKASSFGGFVCMRCRNNFNKEDDMYEEFVSAFTNCFVNRMFSATYFAGSLQLHS
jgi:hypothetical protein